MVTFLRTALLPFVVVTAGVLAIFSLLILAAHGSPPAALVALAEGSFLSRYALFETGVRLTSILLCGLGTIAGFRAGVLNIGLDGQFLAGALAAAAVGPILGGPAGVGLVLLAAVLAGAAAVLPALFLAERRGVPVILSTILLNLVMAAAVTWVVRGPLMDPRGDYPQTAPLPDSVSLPVLFSESRLTVAPFVAVVAGILLSVFLYKTVPGLVMRAVGESPLAARGAGIDEVRVRALAFMVSGGLAGLAGGFEVLAITRRLYDPFSTGAGFTGIAAALLGNMDPAGTIFASLVLAGLGSGSSALQREAGVPAAVAFIVPALAVLGSLAWRALAKRRSS